MSKITGFPLGIAQYSATSFSNNNQLLLTVDSCRSIEGTINEYFTCLVIQDFSGNYIDQLNVRYDFYGIAKPSPDGSFVAFFRELNDDWLEIYSFDGSLISDVITDPTVFPGCLIAH